MSASILFLNALYVGCSGLFVYGVKLLSKPKTARIGNVISSTGMLIAIVATIFVLFPQPPWLLLSIIALGCLSGILLAAKVQMTVIPELVCLFNGLGGLASFLVAVCTVFAIDESHVSTQFITLFAILIGAITFSGSFIAFLKLRGRLNLDMNRYSNLKFLSILMSVAALSLMIMQLFYPHNQAVLASFALVAFLLGLLLVLPIGGADMPVVVSLLNSYSGLAAAAAGIAMGNILLVVVGVLVGASGLILTQIMCKAMNRSFINVIFSGFKTAINKQLNTASEQPKAISVEDAYYIFEAAKSVVIIPGYGMAVSQAQHALKELHAHLEANDAEVVFAIHPVAGRMPGHMNVLLSEADVSYDYLIEMEEINPKIGTFDIALVVGANDVVNPAARDCEESPIYGMPIINADLAKHVFVLKRGASRGFAGIANPLFTKQNTRMIYGDARSTLTDLVRNFVE